MGNEKILKIKPVDSSFKNRCIAYCSKLLFGIISSSSYVNIKKKGYYSFWCKNKYILKLVTQIIYCIAA